MRLKTACCITLCLSFTLLIQSVPTDAAPAANLRGREYYEERGDIVWEVPTEEKFIALTFDDGPDAKQTLLILDLLREYQAKATFFVVGDRVERFPEIVRRELAEGHEVANHSYTHSAFQRLSSGSMEEELNRTQEEIFKATGTRPTLFRPPGGYYNDRLISLSKLHHLQMVLWSWHQDTKDWRSPGVQAIANRVLDNARSGDIVLMHDFVYRSTQTYEALRIILPELKRQGYTLVTVSELLSHKVAPKNHIKVSY